MITKSTVYLCSLTLSLSILATAATAQPLPKFRNDQNFSGSLNHENGVPVRTQVPLTPIYDLIATSAEHSQIEAFRLIDITDPTLDHFANVTSQLLPNQPSNPNSYIMDLKAADLNSDGLDDLIILRNDSSASSPTVYLSVSLFDPINNEYGVETIVKSGNLTAFAVADISNDSLPDIVLTECSSPTGSCYPGQFISALVQTGGGGFSAAPLLLGSILSVTEIAPKIAIGDFNGDGLKDIALRVHSFFGIDVLHEMIQTSPMVFSGPAPFFATSLGTALYDLRASDLNQDGTSELLMAKISSSSGTEFTKYTLTSGIWTASTLIPPAVGARNAASINVADFDSDGNLDLIVGTLATGILVYKQNSAGQFTDVTSSVFVGGNPFSFGSTHLTVADFDLNGRVDIVDTASNVGARFYSGDGVHFVDSTFYRGFQSVYLTAKAQGISKFCSGKFFGNFEDVVVVHGNGLFLAKGDGTGDYRNMIELAPLTGTFQTCDVFDVDGDGDLDIFVSSSEDYSQMTPLPDEVFFMINNSNGTFTKNSLNLQHLGYSVVRAEQADLNTDGRKDLILLAIDGLEVFNLHLMLNTPTGFSELPAIYPSNMLGNDFKVGDFNGDGIDEPVIAYNDGLGSSFVDIFYNQGGTIVPATISNADPAQLLVGDLNGDGADEVIMPLRGIGTSPIIYSNSSYNPTLPPITSTEALVEDINNDGFLDIVYFDPRLEDSYLMYLINNGASFVQQSAGISFANDIRTAKFTDVDNDSDRDLIVAEYSNSRWYGYSQPILVKNLTTQFTSSPIVHVGGPTQGTYQLALDSSGSNGLAVVFASLSPLTSGLPTPFGLFQLSNFTAGPVVSPVGSGQTATITGSLPPAPGLIGQALTMQALILDGAGNLKLTNPQRMELVN